jgi:hypothetical protein
MKHVKVTLSYLPHFHQRQAAVIFIPVQLVSLSLQFALPIFTICCVRATRTGKNICSQQVHMVTLVHGESSSDWHSVANFSSCSKHFLPSFATPSPSSGRLNALRIKPNSSVERLQSLHFTIPHILGGRGLNVQ